MPRFAVRAADGDLVDVDWAADSAFRFFPIERDPVLGWRLQLFDAATNKSLTLAARTETRDYVDIVELGVPGWIGDDPTLRLHAPSVRGCWPTVHGIEGN
jgi:hypothetical protein